MLSKHFLLICTWIVLLGGLIIILQFLVSPIDTRLTHIEEQVNNHIPTEIKEVNHRIDKLQDQTNQRFDQVNQRLGKL